MKLKTYAIALLLTGFVIFPMVSNAQAKKESYLKMEHTKWMVLLTGNQTTDPFYISTKPVTNKEYILFLVWTSNVIGTEYPAALLDVLPGLTQTLKNEENFLPFADSVSFANYLIHAEPFVAQYMFNPTYLHYPVIGVSWEQANLFCQWLSDRYNEYSMINKKYMGLDFNQTSFFHFSTESLIYNRYTGLWDKMGRDEFFSDSTMKGFNFTKYILRPTFHIATQGELELCSKTEIPTVTDKLYSMFDKYSSDGSAFLEPFYKYYLPIYKGFIYTNTENSDQSFYLVSAHYEQIMTLPKHITEWTLDSYLPVEARSLDDIYLNYGFEKIDFVNHNISEARNMIPSKDSLGRMPYIIIGEKQDGDFKVIKKPQGDWKALVQGTPFIYDNQTGTVKAWDGNIFTTFRVAVGVVTKR